MGVDPEGRRVLAVLSEMAFPERTLMGVSIFIRCVSIVIVFATHLRSFASVLSSMVMCGSKSLIAVFQFADER